MGALLIGIILERKEDKNSFTSLSNQNHSNHNSLDGDFDHKKSCGSNNCPLTQLKVSLSQPSIKSIYILYTSMCIIEIISIWIWLIFFSKPGRHPRYYSQIKKVDGKLFENCA